MNYEKICNRYNEIRKQNSYEEAIKQVAKEIHYSKDYTERIVGRAFNETGMKWVINKHMKVV